MNKIKIALLLVFICGFLSAQDTVFSVYSEKKEQVGIMFPKGVYNTEATMDQNIQAWYYKREVPVSAESSSKYIGIFHRVEIYTKKNLIFNGSKNVFIEETSKIYDLPKVFAWEILIIIFISFIMMSFYQKAVLKKTIQSSRPAFVFVLMLGFISMVLAANSFFAPIAMVSLTLSVSYIVPLIIERYRERVSLQRNIFILSYLVIMLIFYIMTKFLPVLISGVSGLVLALPTIYLWRIHERKKRSKRFYEHLISK